MPITRATGKPRRALKVFRARPSKRWPKGGYVTARLGDVVLDLDAAALARWIDDPAAQ